MMKNLTKKVQKSTEKFLVNFFENFSPNSFVKLLFQFFDPKFSPLIFPQFFSSPMFLLQSLCMLAPQEIQSWSTHTEKTRKRRHKSRDFECEKAYEQAFFSPLSLSLSMSCPFPTASKKQDTNPLLSIIMSVCVCVCIIWSFRRGAQATRSVSNSRRTICHPGRDPPPLPASFFHVVAAVVTW